MAPYNFAPVKGDDIEILVKEVNKKYGYDFSQYSRPSLHRRINRIYINWKFKDFSLYKQRLLDDEIFFEHFLQEITVTVTEMFRDPSFFKALINEVFPQLRKLPYIRIWHAGCSTGEEVLSLAILLKEHGLLHKCRLYATDINSKVLSEAKKGSYPISLIENYSKNYKLAGGNGALEDYYTICEGQAVFNKELQKPIAYAVHNLVSDQSFNEFHLVICRNVMIYFNKKLQDRVLKLFSESLASNSYLALGSKESVRFSEVSSQYEILSKSEKIWYKKHQQKVL